MFRRGTVTEAAGNAVEYVDPLAKDEKLRTRLIAALTAARAARVQVQKQTGISGTARRLASDPVLRAHLSETIRQMQAAQKRARKVRSHRLRNASLLLVGIGIAATAVPALRKAMSSLLERNPDEWAPVSSDRHAEQTSTTVEEQI